MKDVFKWLTSLFEEMKIMFSQENIDVNEDNK
jgi:hypothetical protein